MHSKFFLQVISLIILFKTNAFSGQEDFCTLSADHPECCRSNVHMLIHWKANLPLPKAADIEKAPLASNDSEIFLNIDLTPATQGNGYKITPKELPKITGGSQTYLMLPEVCYSLDPASGKVKYGISGRKDWEKGIVTFALRGPNGIRRSYTIHTGTQITVDKVTDTGSGKVSRVYENLTHQLRLEDGVVIPD